MDKNFEYFIWISVSANEMVCISGKLHYVSQLKDAAKTGEAMLHRVWEADLASHWLPWWALRIAVCSRATGQSPLKGSGGVNCTIYRYPGMDIEGRTVAFLIKRIIKYWIWENLVFIEQNGMKS